jgi:hypothetical protein
MAKATLARQFNPEDQENILNNISPWQKYQREVHDIERLVKTRDYLCKSDDQPPGSL